jgi:hypothetical protein
MKKVFLVILSAMSFSSLADYSADVYEMKSNKAKKLYTVSNKTVEKDGSAEAVTVFKDLQGQPVVEEKAQMKGAQLIKLDLEQKQMGATATVEAKDGKIVFTKTENGKTKTADEKLKGDFVISSTFQRFVKEKWPNIQKGENLEFRYGSWERMESVGFEIKKVGEEKLDGQDVVILKMKPSSFIISALVDPLIFKFSPDGSHLLAMAGRVAPKQKSGSSWKDLDAEVFYTHKD